MKIGFIGQGWIGKNYADDFENRGYEVARYALEAPYKDNREAISSCEITFIAVPTPTTPEGFDDSFVADALSNIATENIAVIKSTMLPGTTAALQEKFPGIIVLHSPEFLVEKTAAYDAANPQRNIVGVPKDTKEQNEAARKVLEVLPEAPYQEIMSSLDAELVKYAGNCFLYSKVVFMNMLHDVAEKSGANFAVISEAMTHDPRIGRSHMQPVHDSGRGAGGHCFIKDFEALRQFYKDVVGEDKAFDMLSAQVAYNNHLLTTTGKDIDLLKGVYGEAVVDNEAKPK